MWCGVRKFSAVFLIGALLFGMAAPARAQFGVETKNQLVFWYALKSPYGEQFEALVKDYEKKNSHVTVTVKNFVDTDLLREALKSETNLPDVALIDASWQDELIASGKIVPIEDLMAQASSMARIVFKADLYPALFHLAIKDGKLWTAPCFAIDDALIYNKDMLAAQKLKPPTSWDQVVEMSKKMTDEKTGRWGFQMPLGGSEDLGRFFSLLAWQLGGDVSRLEDPLLPSPPAPPPPQAPTPIPVPKPKSEATPAKDSKTNTDPKAAKKAKASKKKTTLKGSLPVSLIADAATPTAAKTPAPAVPAVKTGPSPAVPAKTPAAPATPAPTPSPTPVVPPPPPPTVFQTVLGFMVDVVVKHRVCPQTPTEDLSKVAMFVGTPEHLLAAEKKGLPVMATPMPTNKQPVCNITCYSFAVFARTKDPAEAYQFAHWSGEFERTVAWVTATPFLPANKQITLCPDYFDYMEKHPAIRVFLAQMAYGHLQPATYNYRKVLTQIGDTVKDAIAHPPPTPNVVKVMVDNSRRIMTTPRSSAPDSSPAHISPL